MQGQMRIQAVAYFLDDGQAQSGAADSRFVNAKEAFQYLFLQRQRNADPVVDNAEQHMIILALQ